MNNENMLKTRACKTCVHKQVCMLSKDFEKLSEELKEKTKMLEYQHFIPKIECKFYTIKKDTSIDNNSY